MNDVRQPQENPVALLFGWVCLVIGSLWLLTTGLCSGYVILLSLTTMESGLILTALGIGAVSGFCAWCVFVLGRALVWPYRKPTDPPHS